MRPRSPREEPRLPRPLRPIGTILVAGPLVALPLMALLTVQSGWDRQVGVALIAGVMSLVPFVLTPLVLVVIVRGVRRARREDGRLCPCCDHLLRGLPDRGTCPECGHDYDVEAIRRMWGLPEHREQEGERRAVQAGASADVAEAEGLAVRLEQASA